MTGLLYGPEFLCGRSTGNPPAVCVHTGSWRQAATPDWCSMQDLIYAIIAFNKKFYGVFILNYILGMN